MLLNTFLGASGVAGVTYFFEERFEAPGGYQNSWTEAGTGTITENYTGVVLEGTQSLRMLMSTNNGTTIATFASDQAELWFFFRMRIVTEMSANRALFVLRDSVAATAFLIQVNTDNGLAVGAAGGGAVTTDKMVTGTDYNVWGHYKKGSGANAEGSVGFSTSGTEVTSGNAFRGTTSGNATQDAHDLRIGIATNTIYEIIWDKFLFSTTGTIGNSPA